MYHTNIQSLRNFTKISKVTLQIMCKTQINILVSVSNIMKEAFTIQKNEVFINYVLLTMYSVQNGYTFRIF